MVYLSPLKVTLDGPLGRGESSASSGRFSLALEECAAAGCRAELRVLELDVPDFDVGVIQLSGLSVRLTQPALGRVDGTQLRVPGQEVELLVEGRAQALSSVTLGDLDLGAVMLDRLKGAPHVVEDGLGRRVRMGLRLFQAFRGFKPKPKP